MITNLVQVQFKSKYGDDYGGRPYTYVADVPLLVGDIVKVPTANGDSDARVCRIDVPESECGFPIDRLRHITEPATPGGGMFAGFFD